MYFNIKLINILTSTKNIFLTNIVEKKYFNSTGEDCFSCQKYRDGFKSQNKIVHIST